MVNRIFRVFIALVLHVLLLLLLLFLEFLLHWFCLYYFSFQRLIWKATRVYFSYFLRCLLVPCLFFLLRDGSSASQERAGLPRLGFYGSQLTSLPSLGMVNAG